MIFIAVLFFIFLIVVHEYGHFIAAKRNGVEVEEFGIGFPPKIYGKTFGKGIWRSYYTINLLPLGGFVRLKGEADADKQKGAYGAVSFWAKTKIILAGVFMNLVIAFLMFTGLAITGIPNLIPDQFKTDSAVTVKDYVAVGFTAEDSPAEQAGFLTGDRLIRVNEQVIESSDDLFDITEANEGQEVTIVYQREGEEYSQTVELRERTEDQSPLGIGPAEIESNKYPLWQAPIVGAGTTLQLGVETYKGLWNLLTDVFGGDFSEAADSVSGPVGIFVILNNASIFGFEYLLFFIGIISLTLAVMNALPIPALDGGKLAVSGMFKLAKKPLTKDVESAIHGSGFVVLMVLILLISFVDVQRFF